MSSHKISSADDVINEASVQASLAQHSADSDVASFRSFEQSPHREDEDEENVIVNTDISNEHDRKEFHDNTHASATNNSTAVNMTMINMDDDDNQVDLTHNNNNNNNNNNWNEHTHENTENEVDKVDIPTVNNSINSLDKFKVGNTTATSSTLSSTTPESHNANEVKPIIVPTSPRLFNPPIVDYNSPKTKTTAETKGAHVHSSGLSSRSVHNNSFGSNAKHAHSDNFSFDYVSRTNSTSGFNPNSSFVDTVRTNVLRNALSPIGFHNTNTNTNTNSNTNNNNNSSFSNTVYSNNSTSSHSRNTTPPFVRRDGLAGAITPTLLEACNKPTEHINSVNNTHNHPADEETCVVGSNNNNADQPRSISRNETMSAISFSEPVRNASMHMNFSESLSAIAMPVQPFNITSSGSNNSSNTSAAHERALRHLKRACEQIKRHQWSAKYETPIGHVEQEHDEEEAIEVNEHSNVTLSPELSGMHEADNVYHEHLHKEDNEYTVNSNNAYERKEYGITNTKDANGYESKNNNLESTNNNNDLMNDSSMDVVISNPDENEMSSPTLLNAEEEQNFVATIRSVISAADRIDEDDDDDDDEDDVEEGDVEEDNINISRYDEMNKYNCYRYVNRKMHTLQNKPEISRNIVDNSNNQFSHMQSKELEKKKKQEEQLPYELQKSVHKANQNRKYHKDMSSNIKINNTNKKDNTPSRRKYAEWRDDDDAIMAPSTFFETNGTLCTNSNVVLKWIDVLGRPAQGDEELVWLYRHTFPLSLLDQHDLNHIINLSLRREYTKDEIILHDNHVLHHLYVVIWGNVEVFHEMTLDNEKKAMDEAFRVSSHAMCNPRHSNSNTHGTGSLNRFCATERNNILKEAPYLLSSMNADSRRAGSLENNNTTATTLNNNKILTMHTSTLQPGQVFGVEGYVFGEVSKYIFKAGGWKSKTVVALIPYHAIENALAHNVRFAQAIGASIVGCVDVFGPIRQFCRYVFSPATAQNEYLPLWSIVDKYTKLGNVIHTKMLSKEIDTGAWGYAINRLPENITSTFCFDLVRALPPFVASRMRVEAHVADVRKQWSSSSSTEKVTTTRTSTGIIKSVKPRTASMEINNAKHQERQPTQHAMTSDTTNTLNTVSNKEDVKDIIAENEDVKKQIVSETGNTINRNAEKIIQSCNNNENTVTFDSQSNDNATTSTLPQQSPPPEQIAHDNSTNIHQISNTNTFHKDNSTSNSKDNSNKAMGSVLTMNAEINRARTDIIYIRTKERRRCTWHLGMEGKALVLLRDGFTDLLDFLTMLCVHIIESNKLRGRIQGMVHPPAIDILDAYLRTRDEENRTHNKLTNEAEMKRIDSILSRMPLMDEERNGLMRIWGANTLLRIYEVMMHREEFNIRVDPSISRTFQTNLFHEWALNLRQCVLEKIGLDRSSPLPEDLCVDVVSSNTHCIKNLLSSFIRKYKEEILEYAILSSHGGNLSLGDIDDWYNLDDVIYVSLPLFLQNARPDLKEEYSKSLEESGITVLHDTAMTGLQVDVIPVHQLDLNTIDETVKMSLQQRVELMRINLMNNNNNDDRNDAESEMTKITNIYALSNDTMYGDFNEPQLTNNNINNNTKNNSRSNTTTNSSLLIDPNSDISDKNNNTSQNSLPTWDEIALPVWQRRKRSKQSERQLNKSSMSSSLMVVSADTTKVNSPMSIIPSQNLSRSVSQPHLQSVHSLNSSEMHKAEFLNKNSTCKGNVDYINHLSLSEPPQSEAVLNKLTDPHTTNHNDICNTLSSNDPVQEITSNQENEKELSQKEGEKKKKQKQESYQHNNGSSVKRLPRHFIINMDFAFGAQAAGICRAVFSVFGKTIRSVSVMGKAGGLQGKRGDIQLASHVLLSKSSLILEDNQDELRPCRNQDLTESRLRTLAGPDVAVHYGKVLTLTGTMLQNVTLLRYYRSVWHCVGTEMEGSYFARVIEDFYRQGIANSGLVTRFAYYSSDLPLAKEDAEQALQQGKVPVNSIATLSAPMTPREGVPPLYAIARGVVENVLLG